jgi:hypothetical protein
LNTIFPNSGSSKKINKISPKWGKHSQIENACGIIFPYGENNPIGFFSRGIFHGTANRSKNPTKIPWGFMF